MQKNRPVTTVCLLWVCDTIKLVLCCWCPVYQYHIHTSSHLAPLQKETSWFFSQNKPEHGPEDKSRQCPRATDNVHTSLGPWGLSELCGAAEGGAGPSPRLCPSH